MTDFPADFNSPPLLDQLRRQDHSCFSRLVTTYHDTLLTVARSIVGAALADEVVQEAWISAYKSSPIPRATKWGTATSDEFILVLAGLIRVSNRMKADQSRLVREL